MASAKKTSATAKVNQIEKRWTKPLTDVGWTALPNIVLDKQVALGLKPLDVNIILQIAKYWWEAGSAPFPSVDTIAQAIGVTPRTVQKRVAALEDAGLIKREKRFHPQGGQRSNAYTFDGLIKRCKPFAEEAKTEREKKKAAEKARIRRKTPLQIVK